MIRRRIVLLTVMAAVLGLTIQCSIAPIIILAANRVVLAEVFSNAGWEYCEAAERSLERLSYDFGDSLAYFTYHSDTLFDTLATLSSLRRARWYGYGLGFEPVSYFDGGDAAAQETLYDAFRTRIEAARSRKTMLEMALDTAATGIEGSEVRVGVRIIPVDTLVNDIENLMLVAVVFADSVAHSRLGSPDTSYVPIAVDVIGGPWGVPVHLSYATELDTVLTTALGNWPQERLGVAVFIQDTSTKAVLQSVVTRKLAQ